MGNSAPTQTSTHNTIPSQEPTTSHSQSTTSIKPTQQEEESLNSNVPTTLAPLEWSSNIIQSITATKQDDQDISQEQIISALRQALPPTEKFHSQWLLLYSSIRDGLSVATFQTKVINRGPFLIIIRDKLGHIFGGFCSQGLKKSNQFYGTSDSFLFSLSPTLKLYRPSSNSKNVNFMYFNMEADADKLYNGFGMGGQMNFFSLSLDEHFAHGTTRPGLATYGFSPILCGYDENQLNEYEFVTDAVEVISFPLTESQQLDLLYKQAQKNARNALQGDAAEDVFIMQTLGKVSENMGKKQNKTDDELLKTKDA